MKSFIYCRQSVGEADPNESLSLNVQEVECKKLADSKSANVIHVFKEPNTSGRLYPTGFESLAANDFTYQSWCQETKKIGKWRTQFGELLRRLDEVDTIICYDITRLHRSLNGSYQENLIKQVLNANNIKVLTVKEGEVDFSKFTDQLVTSLTSQINSEQLLIQREKAKAGLRRLKDNGEYYSGFAKCIGFKQIGGKRVEVIPHEAEIVKKIYRMFTVDGMTLNEIVREIGEEYHDVFPKCYSNTMKNILLNPIYAGYMRTTDGDLIKAKQVEGMEIVTLDEWMNADKILSARKLSTYRHKINWLPLTPFIYCGHCGEKMRSHLGANLKSNYSCQRHIRDNNTPCKNTIMASYEGKEGCGLLETIRPLLLAEAIRLMSHKDDKSMKNQLNEVEIALMDIKKKAQKFTEMFTASTMDESIYENAMRELKTKEGSLIRRKTELEMSLNRDTSQFDWIKLMMKFRGDSLTEAEYTLLASSMLKKILIYRDFIEIKTTYGDVTIPRQRIYKWRLTLNYDLQMKKKEAFIFYYHGKARIISNKERESAKLIDHLGNVKMFLID